FPGIWDTAVVDGELVGVPWYVDTRLLYYRKDLLREAGVAQVPRTWAEWEQAMAAIMAQGVPGRHAILMPLNEFEQQLSFALQQGDPLLRDHDTRGNFESPGFRRALAFYAGMFERGWAPKVSETQISNVWDEFFRGSYRSEEHRLNSSHVKISYAVFCLKKTKLKYVYCSTTFLAGY